MKRARVYIGLTVAALLVSACSTSADVKTPRGSSKLMSGGYTTSGPDARGFLPDRVHYLQKDPRWAQDTLGQSGDSLAAYGCVVTSVAIALGNLGFETDPGDLNRRLSETGNYTPRGWLKWKGVAEVTDGKAEATYYSDVNAPLIRQCLARGDYPLVRFKLPNGRTHWAVIIGQSQQGYHMRDPLRDTRSPLVFPRNASAFEALRCVGLADS